MSVTIYPRIASVRPAVSVTVNTDALEANTSDSNRKLMLVGMADGGVPGTVYKIDNFSQARQIFRGGDVLDAIELALTPNSDISTGEILAERVGTATPASFSNNGITFTSNLYSKDANNIQVSLQDNSLNNTKTAQVSFADDQYNIYYSNLGNIFTLSYTGSGYASVEITTDGTTGFATHLILKQGNDSSSAVVVKDFLLGSGLYANVNQMINDINQIQNFSADYYIAGAKNIETKYLDAMPETQIKSLSTNVGTTQGNNSITSSTTDAGAIIIKSVGGDLVNTLSNDQVVNVEYDPSKGEPNSFNLTNLSGGTSSDIAPASWSEYFQNFATEDGYYLVPLTEDPAVQAEGEAFIEDCTANGRPMSMFVGGGINEPVQQSISRATALQTTAVKIVVNASSGTRLMSDGTTRALPGYMMAALIAGLASGIPAGESILYKEIDMNSIDQAFTKDQLDTLDLNGVIAVEVARNNQGKYYRVSDDVTTAVTAGSKDPAAMYLSVGVASDFLVNDLKDALEVYIGKRTGLSTAKDIKTTIISFLTAKQSIGEVVDFSEGDIQVTVMGSDAYVSISLVPVQSIRKIQVSLVYHNESITA